MGVQEALLGNFGHIEVAEDRTAILVQENVCGFNVSVEDLHVVEHGQSLDCANEVLPDLLFRESRFLFFVFHNFLVKISISGKVHHNTKGLALVDEALLVPDDVLVLNTGQNSDLIQGVFSLFLR